MLICAETFTGGPLAVMLRCGLDTQGRYRLQSDRLEAMWVVADELSRRLAAYYQVGEVAAGHMHPSCRVPDG